jgi:hypothetical protein
MNSFKRTIVFISLSILYLLALLAYAFNIMHPYLISIYSLILSYMLVYHPLALERDEEKSSFKVMSFLFVLLSIISLSFQWLMIISASILFILCSIVFYSSFQRIHPNPLINFFSFLSCGGFFIGGYLSLFLVNPITSTIFFAFGYATMIYILYVFLIYWIYDKPIEVVAYTYWEEHYSLIEKSNA